VRRPIAAIAERIAAQAGLRPPAWVVEARAADRARARGLRIEDYAPLLERDAGELDALIEAVRVGETRFFRHREQIESLRRRILPELALRHPPGATVRGWSAGCATGEEAWTLAILLCEALPGREVQVLGSDLSDDALARARAARYPADAVASLDAPVRRAWFVARGDEVEVAPGLRDRVRFERRNLIDEPPDGPRDVVLCRNVLMYFDRARQRTALAHLVEALAPGGFLVLGYAETGLCRDAAVLVPL
jgi:chemotaxis methyl-accepting protein methylase